MRKLTDDGWVTKSENPDDRRVTLLHITPKTQKAFDRIYDKFTGQHHDIMHGNCDACAANIGAQTFSNFERHIEDALTLAASWLPVT